MIKRIAANLGTLTWRGGKFEPRGPLMICRLSPACAGDVIVPEPTWSARIVVAGEERQMAVETVCELLAHATPLHQDGVVIEDTSEEDAAAVVLVCPANFDHRAWLGIIANLIEQLTECVRDGIVVEVQYGERTREVLRVEERSRERE